MGTVNQAKPHFDYIVALWFGDRRKSPPKDKYYFLKQHCSFLENTLPITRVIFVINGACDYDEVMQIIREYNIIHECIVLERENKDYSYGAWMRGLQHGLQEGAPEYAFLCEDDYVPTTNKFYEPFLSKFNSQVGYVTSLFKDKHCAISNGFIDYAKIEPHRIFTLTNADRYNQAERNQVNFLKHYKWEIRDISECCVPFYDHSVKSIIEYGTPDAYSPIIPIVCT